MSENNTEKTIILESDWMKIYAPQNATICSTRIPKNFAIQQSTLKCTDEIKTMHLTGFSDVSVLDGPLVHGCIIVLILESES